MAQVAPQRTIQPVGKPKVVGGPAAPTPVPAASTPAPLPAGSAQLQNTLAQFGLTGLGNFITQKVKAGESLDQIMLEIRATPEYQARFPAMQQLAQQGRAISEQQYVDLENQYQGILRSAGLPSGFYDTPQDFANLITNQVSPSELSSRVQQYATVAYNSPPEVKQQLEDLYGITPGELTAYFIDPNNALPLIQQRVASAQAAGQAQISGFGQLTRTQADELGQAGVTADAARSGFQQLGMESQLMHGLPGEGAPDISTDQQLSAQFLGNAQAALTIKNRALARVAAFQDAAGFLESADKGAVGLGQELH